MIVGLLAPAFFLGMFQLWLASDTLTKPKFLPEWSVMASLCLVLAIATICTLVVLAYRPECSYSQGAAVNIENGRLQIGYIPPAMNARSRRDYCYDIGGTPATSNSLANGVSVLACCKGDCATCDNQQCGTSGRTACCLTAVADSATCVWNASLQSQPPCAIPLPVPTEPLHPETPSGNQMISSPSGQCGSSTSDDPLKFDFRLSEASLNFDLATVNPQNCRNPNFYSMFPEGTPSQEYRLECDAWDSKVVSTSVAVASFTDLAENMNTNAGECSLTSDTSCASPTLTVHDSAGDEISCSGGFTTRPPVVFTITRTEDVPDFSFDALPPEQFSLSGCSGMIAAVGFPDSTITCPEPGNLRFHSMLEDSTGNPCGDGPLECNIDSDTTAPSVSISSPNGKDQSIVNDDPVIFKFTLSEDSPNFFASTVRAVNCPKPEFYRKVGNVPTDYILKCKGVDGEVSAAVEPSSFTDLAGNANVQGEAFTLTVVLADKFVVAMQPTVAGIPVQCNGTSTSDGPIIFTFTLTEPSTNFGLASLVTENCFNPSFTGNSTIFHLACDSSPASAPPLDIGVTLPSGRFTDGAGNGNQPLDRCVVTSDNQPPNVIISSPTARNGGFGSIGDGCKENLLEFGQQNVKKATFGFLVNECSNFSQQSIRLHGCSEPEFTSDTDTNDDDNAVYQFWVECVPSASKVSASVNSSSFADCAGNQYKANSTVPNTYGFNMNIDAAGNPQWPTVAISSPGGLNGGYSNADTFIFVFNLSASSADFSADTISKDNCNDAMFVVVPASENRLYQLTCAAAASITVAVAPHSWTSTEGDCNAAGAEFTIHQDLVSPVATITSEDGMDMYYARSCQNCNNVTIHFDIHLSEPTITFDA
eukprot:SAG31_NODE_4717_length_3011_cov_1.616758_1_plen_873_part_01